MTATTTNWWKKAEGDYSSMQKEFAPPPNFDACCFHAQQCIEKLLKAVLVERNVRFSKTHNLPDLARMLSPTPRGLEEHWRDLESLTEYAVTIRYPIEFAGRREAEDAMEACARVRLLLLRELGIPGLFEE